MINIINILKDMSKDTKLYSSAIGRCKLLNVGKNDIIVRDFRGNDYTFNSHGILIDTNGECTLFPSKLIRDWTKFSWKKGDVLSCGVDNFCIFDNWTNDDYTEFHAKYDSVTYGNGTYNTLQWTKVDDEKTIKQYISNIEEIKCGKLNLETLEIEKQPQFKDGDIVTLFKSVSGRECCKRILVFKNFTASSVKAYVEYDVNDGISFNSEIVGDFENCLATDSEKQQLFDALAKEGKRWNPDTKQIENLSKEYEFKPFDKVLVRDDNDAKWEANIFGFIDNEYTEYKYSCVCENWRQCIPYNENTAHLLGTTDNYEE